MLISESFAGNANQRMNADFFKSKENVIKFLRPYRLVTRRRMNIQKAKQTTRRLTWILQIIFGKIEKRR